MKKSIIPFVLTLVFSALLIGFKFSFHELWKDEWQAWFDAKDMSLMEMLSFLNYEGHPSLWYLYLKIWTPLSSSIYESSLIQAAHSLVYVGVFYLFFTKLRIPIVLKVFLALGYFMFFEYGVVNRAYGMVVLFAFYLVHLIQDRKTNHWTFYLTLFMICQTEIYGLFIGGALLFYALIEKGNELDLRSNIKSLSAYAFGFLIFVLTVYPRGNEEDFSRAYLQEPFSIDVLLNSFQGNFANTYLIGSISDTNAEGWSLIGLILSLVVLLGLVSVFWNRKKLLLTWALFAIGFYLFNVIIYSGGVRQWGMIFIFFICLLSLYDLKLEKENALMLSMVSIFALFQIVHGVKAIYFDATKPFTNAKSAGEFIKEKVPAEVPVVAINKFENTPVLAYAERKFYALPDGEEFSYFKWLEKIYLPSVDELKLFGQYKSVGGIIIVSPRKLEGDAYRELQFWQAFDGPSFKREDYYVYTLAVR